MLLGHRIRLHPTPKQERYFRSACGVARFAYNWALHEWREAYSRGERPSEAALRRQLNAMKSTQFPWMLGVSKNAPQQAIKNLGDAYDRYIAGVGKCGGNREPRFKRKGIRDRFRADNGPRVRGTNAVRIMARRVWVPRVGWVSMRENIRFDGQIKSLVISRTADKWYASFAVDVAHHVPQRTDHRPVGVDLGISTFATLSTGAKISNPEPLKKHLRRLRRLAKAASRKQWGSRNAEKANLRLARLHERIANIRSDGMHKLTSLLAAAYSLVVIEDLSVKGMVRNRHVGRAVSDCAFGEFRRQLEYKCPMSGSTLKVAGRFFPSSKMCSVCGRVNKDLPWGLVRWLCSCGAYHDRDINAAKNLLRTVSSTG